MDVQSHAVKLQELQNIAEKEIDLDEWFRQRDELVNKSTADHFANDVVLHKKDEVAQKKLAAMRTNLLQKDPTINTGNYYEKLPGLLASELYDCLNVMPKPAIHHIHLTAACPLDFLVKKLTYYDYVYFNQSEGDPNGLWDGLGRRVVVVVVVVVLVVVVGVRGSQKMQL